jgi:hypothetical protein
MTKPIFARPRHWYDSYTDFWTLVNLCGYEWCYLDDMDTKNPDALYIFTGPEAKHEFKGAKARIIYWLLEWYGDYEQREGIAETWTSNRTYAEMVGAKFVPMGGHPDLGNPKRGDGRFHIAHMSYAGIHRRSLLLGKIKEAANRWGEWDFAIAPNAWGEDRDFNLHNSRMMIHIHQNEAYPAIAPLRAVLAAAYALPLVAENGWSADPYQDHCYVYAYKDMPEAIMSMLQSKNLDAQGQALHQHVCHDLRFDKVVETNL